MTELHEGECCPDDREDVWHMGYEGCCCLAIGKTAAERRQATAAMRELENSFRADD